MQAPVYTRSTGFAADERANTGGRSTVRTDRLDAELDTLGATANTTRNNLELIQRDDGRLRDGVVATSALSQAVVVLFSTRFTPRGEWAAATIYAASDLVELSGASYVAPTAHTSGADFAADRAAGLWQLFPGQPGASTMPFEPTDDIVATNVQDAIKEVRADASQLSLATLAFNYGGF